MSIFKLLQNPLNSIRNENNKKKETTELIEHNKRMPWIQWVLFAIIFDKSFSFSFLRFVFNQWQCLYEINFFANIWWKCTPRFIRVKHILTVLWLCLVGHPQSIWYLMHDAIVQRNSNKIEAFQQQSSLSLNGSIEIIKIRFSLLYELQGKKNRFMKTHLKSKLFKYSLRCQILFSITKFYLWFWIRNRIGSQLAPIVKLIEKIHWNTQKKQSEHKQWPLERQNDKALEVKNL